VDEVGLLKRGIIYWEKAVEGKKLLIEKCIAAIVLRIIG
jgi:hypothetical protein